MAIGLENNPNNSAITVAYPYGGIKDNTGAGDGTPINKLTNDDIHQTLRKILALANITPNGLPDNVTNGFQYITALNRLFKKFTGVFNDPTNPTFSLTAAHVDKLINIAGNTADKSFTLPNSNTLQDGDTFTFYNNSGYIGIVQSGTDFVNGGADITLRIEGDFVELVLDKANFNWVPTQYKYTPVTPYPIFVFNTISIALSAATSDILKFQTHQYGNASLYDISTGRFTPTTPGVYEITWSVIYDTNGVGVQDFVGTNARKNGVQIGFITDRQDVYPTSEWLTLSGSVIVEANGTDYFDIQVYSGTALDKNIYGNFHAKRIVS